MITLIVLLATYVGLHFGLFKLFPKAGEAAWKAWIPFYSEAICCKIIGRPMWWSVLLWIPIVGFFVGAGMLIDLAKSFRRFSFGDAAASVAVPFVFFPMLGMRADAAYMGPAWKMQNDLRKRLLKAKKENDSIEMRAAEEENPFPKKSVLREWTESIIFAVFAAHFIRLFLIEAYTIPTPSMEGSLLVGDFLFVSKVHYGSRMPITPISFPLLHNTLPFTGGESYTTWLQWGYNRAPKLQNVELYDPVVFNYPEGDTVIQGAPFERQYYELIKHGAPRAEVQRRFKNKLIWRPVDKRDHYIKRCVGLPGDVIQVKDGILFINNEKAKEFKGIQYKYRIFSKGLNAKKIEGELPVTFERGPRGEAIIELAYMSPKVAEEMKTKYAGQIDSIKRILLAPEDVQPSMYPYSPRFKWNIDHYGPIQIPKKGMSVPMTPENLDIYRRVITAYEGNSLEIKDGKVWINNQEATEYTFKLDYYWMMGDNRNNSADSRSWGFVPEDHVVGKPLFVWMSLRDGSFGGGVRWSRLFMGASGKEE